MQLYKLVKQFEEEFHQLQQQLFKFQQSIHVLEVFCDSNSEVTKQTQNLGYSAQRHSMEQGDLATQEGRDSLFQKVIALQPKNIWISPTCGPWSSWSNLNAQESWKVLISSTTSDKRCSISWH